MTEPRHVNQVMQQTLAGIERRADEAGNTNSPAYRKWREEMRLMFGDDVFSKKDRAA